MTSDSRERKAFPDTGSAAEIDLGGHPEMDTLACPAQSMVTVHSLTPIYSDTLSW